MILIFASLLFDKQRYKQPKSSFKLGLISLIWLLGGICDRIWYGWDNSVPAWDQADYLNGALNYWHALETSQFFNQEWWRGFWLLSNKIPPLHYILTAPFLHLFSLGEDSASLVMSFYSGILLIAVYGLGRVLFGEQVGITAAIICQFLPGLYYYRLEFLLDYPLTAITVFSFWLLTLWRLNRDRSWLLGIAFGFSLGFALLLKQTALFFLVVPLLWSLIATLKNRQWLRLGELLTAILLSIAVCYPWYRTNWLLILTSSKRATIDSAIAEGDPALNTLEAWLYYLKTLPFLLSWSLLLIPLVGLLLYKVRKLFPASSYSVTRLSLKNKYAWRWLLVYLIAGYLLSSFNINKDARYVLPLLPVLALGLAVGFYSYGARWRKYILTVTIVLALGLMLLNIFPLPGGKIAQFISPKVRHYPYLGAAYPHQEVIQNIIQTEPYLRTTLGVLPSTPTINQHNFSFYGGQQNFQVVGRQVGIQENETIADMRSLDWFLTKTGEQGSVPPAQATMTKLVTESELFSLHNSWQLPDGSQLNLSHRKQPTIEVIPLKITTLVEYKAKIAEKIQLQNLTIDSPAISGKAVAITYEWWGNWQQLESGIVLLTWQEKNRDRGQFWLHDHAIAMGLLDRSNLASTSLDRAFTVRENTAMLIPPDINPGEYQLTATYLNRQTKESYPISLPDITIVVNSPSNSAVTPTARELDLVTQLRTIAPTMASGIAALEPIFAQTARINQYDGKQDYLAQTELALNYRLRHDSASKQQQIPWHYAIALSQVLQQDVSGAIASWQEITQLQPNNPYAFAYLAFVYLYDWQPSKAEIALKQAQAINPAIPEIVTLQGIAALMQGNFFPAWQLLKPLS